VSALVSTLSSGADNVRIVSRSCETKSAICDLPTASD
jgi:hypothetical protein